jgi:chromosome segregation ATPase
MSADLEQRIANLEKFAADVREFTSYLRDVIRRYDERLDEHENLFHESDEKIAALADAQIKTEDALQRLAGSVARHTGDGHGGA